MCVTRYVVKKEVNMVEFKNYTVQQLEAALDVIEHIEKAGSPLLECIRLSAGILKELDRRLDDMEEAECAELEALMDESSLRFTTSPVN